MNFINKIRLFFLKKNLLIILGKIRILQMEVSRLEKILDEKMIGCRKNFLQDVKKVGEEIAEMRAMSPVSSHFLPAVEVSQKIDNLKKEIETLFDERRDLQLNAVELKGVCQTPSINAEMHKMLA
jgi:regulator of replication initiation timing